MSDQVSQVPIPHWSLFRRDKRQVVVDDLRIADGYWSKLAGLQFRATLPVGRALLLTKSSSVHTFWMRFALDVAFIARDGAVLEMRRALAPWRIAAGPKGTHAVLESKTGWIKLEAGDRLIAVCTSPRELNRRDKSLRFLNPTAASELQLDLSRRTETEHQHA